jgi:dihydroxyacetone kinase/dihydroxyacetone kinase-like protein
VNKLLNQPENFVDEAIEGILLAYPKHFRAVPEDSRVLVRADGPAVGQVGIVTGGGFGHLPLFLGYVGPGLATSVAVGNVFSAQSSDAALAAIHAAESGSGTVVIIGNYTGDRLNFELAQDMVEADGGISRLVRVGDDIASAPVERRDDRRGVAGIFFTYKCAGAASAEGRDLDEVTAIAQKAAGATRTMGVGMAPATLPTTGRPTFTLPEGEMEFGIGIHGEPGIRRGPVPQADSVADDILDQLMEELDVTGGSSVALLVNGLGATAPEELYILTRRVHQRLRDANVHVHRSYVGEFATSLEMAGASVSLCKLDAELAQLLDAPATSPLVPGSL